TPGGQIGGMAEIAVPNRSVVNFQEERLALVGLPCELQGFWRMNTHWIAAPKLGRNLVFTIGLFCSKVFDYQKMMVDYVQGRRGYSQRGGGIWISRDEEAGPCGKGDKVPRDAV